MLCASCATKSHEDDDELDQFKPVASDIHWEGDALQCEQCNAQIDSAYGPVDE